MDYSKIITLFCSLAITCTAINAFADSTAENNQSTVHMSALYLQPYSKNLKYAVFVSGNQPYQQSWHNQAINPGYSAAFETGLMYAIPHSLFNLSVDWLHAGTSDADMKQASTSIAVSTIQFVAPPYDVGPGVFGIKRASSNVSNNFNSVYINFGRVFEYGPYVQGRVFSGVNVLNLSQNLTTTFNDFAGALVVPGQAYFLPPDPDYYFTTVNTSKYLGVGPDIGVNIKYQSEMGLGVIGQFAGSLTVGSMQTQDTFTSSSQRLIFLGLSPSHQAITAPNATQLVPGFDSKLGVLYAHTWKTIGLMIESGYRFAYYFNAISSLSPDTLVQASVDPTIPEFATGTMAINSTTSTLGPFSLSGPYLNVTITLV